MSLSTISVSWITELSTLEIIKRSIELTPIELQHYKQKSQLLQMFQVTLDSHNWTVLKTMHEMVQFLAYLEKKYTPHEQRKKKIPNAPVPRILNIVSSELVDYEDQKLISFFQLYDMEFNKVMSLKLNKNSGGRYANKLCWSCSCFQWKQRQFVITSNGILYHKQKHGEKKICEYISFNKYFSYQFGMETGDEFGILIRSYHRRLRLRANNFIQFVIAIYYIEKAFKQYNEGRQQNLYGSFAPGRDNNDVQFLVDGQEYFGAVAKEISRAKHQVMIAGWWISPQFYLVRPIDPLHPQRNRLSTILRQIISKNNVKIYILAYRQSPLFLPNDSKYTKEALQSISPNIKVITHPINIIPSLWSHHEKIVLIDQRVAFLGGLDMCYGRYDNSQHSIKDKENLYPGIEFNNSRIKDFQKVRDYELSNIMRSQHPRLPWHDVGVKLIGGVVSDVAKHFIQYWNFACYEELYQERIVLVPEEKKISARLKDMFGGLKNKLMSLREGQEHQNQGREKAGKDVDGRQVKNQTINKMVKEQMQESPEVKQYTTNNFLPQQNNQSGQQIVYRYAQQQKKIQKKQPSTNQTLRLKNQQSLPPDNRKLGYGKGIRKLFVSNQKDHQQDYDSDHGGQYLNQRQFDFEKGHQDLINSEKEGRFRKLLRKIQSFDERRIIKEKKIQQADSSQKSTSPLQNTLLKDRCQVLRSVAKWSIGCKQTESESSIHEAYIDMIKNAQHFIYIENQFFMSATQGEKVLKNQVARALIERVSRAIDERKKFRVLFFMPLIPGFAGELDSPEAILPRVILHWQYLTIFTGQNSVIKSISRLTPDPSKYIQFYGLRTHALMNHQPKTQIIYLHTKLMIVDDRKAIIGSANINDRSMRGTRDSEIAIQLSGGKMVESVVDGMRYEVNDKIKTLRVKLMRQHFGSKDIYNNPLEFSDLLDSKMFQRIQNVAEQNTTTYRKLFGCYPDNDIQTLRQLNMLKRTPTKEEYLYQSMKLHGHVVHFPYKFLSKEKLLQGNSIYPNAITT